MLFNRINKGSSLVEYIIPAAVVGLSLGFTIYNMQKDGTLQRFLQKSMSSNNIQSGCLIVGSMGDASDTSTTGTTDTTDTSDKITGATASGNLDSTTNVAGTDINYYDSGDVSFNSNGQNVVLKSDIMADINEVMETTGVNGANTQIVNAINALITSHAAEYPDADVPIDIQFGTSERSIIIDSNCTDYYKGEVAVNSVQLSVGDHLIMIVKDQTLESYSLVDSTITNDITTGDGIHVIDGTLSGDNFTGEITDGSYSGSDFNAIVDDGTFTGNSGTITDLGCWNIVLNN